MSERPYPERPYGPPFRADQVGSLLRPERVKRARAQYAAGEIDAAALREIEDDEIRRVVARQEEIGLRLATDGELRRSWWHYDFLEHLDGVRGHDTDEGLRFRHVQTRGHELELAGPLRFSQHPMLDDFAFLQRVTRRAVPKMTIPSPCMILYSPRVTENNVYPDRQAFLDALAAAYRRALRAFYDLGCRYLQLDDTSWTILGAESYRERLRAQGRDPDALAAESAELVRAALAERPAGMAVTMHVCRGNYRSDWAFSGGYDPVAEVLFGTVPVDAFFLEYDDERAGGFQPLRYLSGQGVVLGLITTKNGELEDKDAVKRRIDEASHYLSAERLGLSPQCGFASTEEGNLLSEDEQWAKLRLVCEIVHEVWNDA